jgi:hypothetical protein
MMPHWGGHSGSLGEVWTARDGFDFAVVKHRPAKTSLQWNSHRVDEAIGFAPRHNSVHAVGNSTGMDETWSAYLFARLPACHFGSVKLGSGLKVGHGSSPLSESGDGAIIAALLGLPGHIPHHSPSVQVGISRLGKPRWHSCLWATPLVRIEAVGSVLGAAVRALIPATSTSYATALKRSNRIASRSRSGRSLVRPGRWMLSPFSRLRASSIGPSFRPRSRSDTCNR